MALAELLLQIIIASLMHNSKMERDMDTIDILDKIMAAFKKNIKMVS